MICCVERDLLAATTPPSTLSLLTFLTTFAAEKWRIDRRDLMLASESAMKRSAIAQEWLVIASESLVNSKPRNGQRNVEKGEEIKNIFSFVTTIITPG